MVGNQNGVRTGLQGFQRALDGHNALDDEGQTSRFLDFPQLLHSLAARGGIHTLQERQTRRVNVHGGGEGAALPDQRHLLPDQFHVPGLDGGYAHAAHGGNGTGGLNHNVGVQAVAGKGGNARLGAAADQRGIIGLVIVFVAVVQRNGTDRARKNRSGEGSAEEGESRIRIAAGTQSVHVHPDLLPGVIVPDRRIAYTLGSGAGNRIAAGQAVADGARLALAHIAFGLGHCFLISHDVCTILMFCSVSHYSTAEKKCTART